MQLVGRKYVDGKWIDMPSVEIGLNLRDPGEDHLKALERLNRDPKLPQIWTIKGGSTLDGPSWRDVLLENPGLALSLYETGLRTEGVEKGGDCAQSTAFVTTSDTAAGAAEAERVRE